jgi:hypothetical protein
MPRSQAERATKQSRKACAAENPRPDGSLAYAAWVFAPPGRLAGYYGRPGPIVMLHGLVRLHAIKPRLDPPEMCEACQTSAKCRRTAVWHAHLARKIIFVPDERNKYVHAARRAFLQPAICHLNILATRLREHDNTSRPNSRLVIARSVSSEAIQAARRAPGWLGASLGSRLP